MYSRFGSVKVISQRIRLEIVKSSNEETPEEEQQYENRTSYLLTPAPWLRNIGLNRTLYVKLAQSTSAGWQTTFKVYNEIKFDSLIFVLCQKGDVSAVRSLLIKGDASVWDRDPDGCTPLWVSQHQ